MLIGDQITAAAASASLPRPLVMALVSVESGGNPWAWNPEPAYRYLWDVKDNAPFRKLAPEEYALKKPPMDFPSLAGDPDQEWCGQQASWGLMQVMGAVARERGFRGLYLPALCDPETNLRIGCGILAANLRWSGGEVNKALAAYNAGRGGWTSVAGQAYAAKVLGRISV